MIPCWKYLTLSLRIYVKSKSEFVERTHVKAQLLEKPAPISQSPLHFADVPKPEARADELLVRVKACGVCHTDLHVTEGDLPAPKLPLIPGHEVVGIVEETGSEVTRYKVGDRVGIPWLHNVNGDCEYAHIGQENLCDNAIFTGYTADGGYAEYVTVPESFAVPIPDDFTDVQAAPLLCAGIVGYRSVRLSNLQPGERLGLYGFGASAHLMIQVATHWGCEVSVFTRSETHRQHASELGAVWVGDAQDSPPIKLDRSIIFAPAGWIVPLALGHLRKGGTLCINAIHMSDIPTMPYDLIWHERTIQTVANATRRDAEQFMPLAAEIGIQSETTIFELKEANRVLQMLKKSEINGAAVLVP